DLLDQALSFVQVEAGLMFRPQLLDPWFADEGGWAATYGVDANVGLGAAWPWVNILGNGAVARVALAALGDLGPEDRPLQGLHLAPNAYGTQVRKDTLAHVKVRWKGYVPF